MNAVVNVQPADTVRMVHRPAQTAFGARFQLLLVAQVVISAQRAGLAPPLANSAARSVLVCIQKLAVLVLPLRACAQKAMKAINAGEWNNRNRSIQASIQKPASHGFFLAHAPFQVTTRWTHTVSNVRIRLPPLS
jgi:hypothetical protein